MHEILTAIEAAITAAPEQQRNELAQALEDWSERYPRSTRRSVGTGLVARGLVSVLVEASEAHSHLG